MVSKLHQMLVGLIGRKMREKGYEIVAFDGSEYLFDGQALRTPPIIKRHRPDLIGINTGTKSLCIGEAKTIDDLSSRRTKEQLLDYASTGSTSTGKNVEIIIGIPQSAEVQLTQLLRELQLAEKDYISYVFLPEELV